MAGMESLGLVLSSIFVILHFSLMSRPMANGLKQLKKTWQQLTPLSPQQKQHELRIAEELDEVRRSTRARNTFLTIHPLLVMILEALGRFTQAPDLSVSAELIPLLIIYVHDMCIMAGYVELTVSRVRCINQFLRLMTLVHALQASSDPATFMYQEKIHLSAVVSLALEDLDWRLTAVHCVLMGGLHMSAATNTQLLQQLAAYGLIVLAAFLCEYQTRQRISAVLESNEKGTLLKGVQRMLKGVADGNVLLDQDFQIVGNSGGLQQLLSSREELSGSSFRSLLNSEDDKIFLNFITASSQQEDAQVPACSRISLMGQHGEVGVDLFHVSIAGLHRSDEIHHLLAIKQDADVVAPDAQNSMAVPVARGLRSSRASTASSVIDEGFEELQEATLLLNTQRPQHDIIEAHLRFKPRRGREEGMPSLRRLTRTLDWPSLLETLDGYDAGRQQSLNLGSLVLRVPGSQRLYVKAKEAAVSSPDMGRHLWLHLKHLDKRCLRRGHEASLEDILEQ